MSTEPAPPTANAACPPKSIVLFSDGTGNSSAKLFKTNVWRMYEAVDLGPTTESRPQIAYYDDGVGTSGFKPLAVLGGVFGYGLKRNVLDIYKYACRNYNPGDDIYAFGFSRGAFTIRLVVALIAEEGLVGSRDEGELDRLSRCAYRKFRRMWLPRQLKRPTQARRWIHDAISARLDSWFKRRPTYAEATRHHPPIKFVGVWDTVSAYGGPSVELTRAIDNWIFPLSMPDYELHTKVECARHALALDDERDAFHPLLWDEVHEQGLIDRHEVAEDRLRQVWFTGMHSDVGGGYPDESLSYVSLLWMMEEAKKAGLRTLDMIRERFIALASSAGPIHDSRKGLAAYYRYQPRRIAAWVDPVDDKTYGLRDPQIIDKATKQPKGLLKSVKVHGSVIARIAGGTDRYAPLTLPAKFEIFPPQTTGENVPQAVSGTEAGGAGALGVRAREDEAPRPRPLVSDDVWTRLHAPGVLPARAAAFEAVWDSVWRRRVVYFVTIAFTLLLATMPAWIAVAPEPLLLVDGRTWIDAPLRAAGVLLPGFLSSWVDTFADNPFYFLVLAGCIWAALKYASSCERRLRDCARHIWHATVDPNATLPVAAPETRLARLRNSSVYQWTMKVSKWQLLPGVLTILMVVAAAWLGAAGLTQAYLPWLESGTALCKSNGREVGILVEYEEPFTTAETCHAVGATVIEGRRYRVELRVLDPWFDGGHPTNPQGLRARDSGPTGILGGPFRRVIEANYLQPVIEIRQASRRWRLDGLHIYPLPVIEQEPGLFTTEFKAPRGGELFVFVNDAVWPLQPTFFYDQRPGYNNGTASLKIVRLDEAPKVSAAGPPPAPPPTPSDVAVRR